MERLQFWADRPEPAAHSIAVVRSPHSDPSRVAKPSDSDSHMRVCVLSVFDARSLAASAQGFDEYMNLVLDDASEVDMKQKSRKSLGRVMLKGDNITAIFNVPQ